MARLLVILLIGLIFEAIGVVLLSRGLKEISGWVFLPSQIRDPEALCRRLRDQTDPVSQLAWAESTPRERAALANTNSPALQKRAAAQALNRLLPSADLYRRGQYDRMSLPTEARELLAESPEEEDLLHLNRLLLDQTYSSQVDKVPADVSRAADILRRVGRGVSNAHILLGVFFEALFFIALLMLMSRAEVSFVWPLTSLSFVVTTIAAKLYLHEHVSPLRWSGVALIMLGAGLISWTEKHPQKPAAVPESTVSLNEPVSKQ